MNKTQNFEFNIPSGNDYYYVEDFNENFRKIDQEIKPADTQLDKTSTNPVQNKVVAEAFDAINHDLGGLKFEQNAEGNWGYIPSGADTVIPFRPPLKRVALGSFTGANTGVATFSAKEIAGYDKLTVNNFGIALSSLYVEGGVLSSPDAHVEKGSVYPSISYDASSGTVKLYGLLNQLSKWSGDHYYVAKSYVTGTLYCYV